MSERNTPTTTKQGLTSEIAHSVAEMAAATPNSVEARKTEAAVQALSLAAEGLSDLSISKRCGLSDKTIRRLRRDHAAVVRLNFEEVARRRAQLEAKMRSLALQKAQLLDPMEVEGEEREKRLEALKDTPLRELMVGYGIAADKALAAGADMPAPASSGVSVPGLQEVAEMIAKARERARARAAQDLEDAVERELARRKSVEATVIDVRDAE